MQCFLLRPNGREVMGATSPNATRPNGRLHWATIVAHYRALAAFAAYAKLPLGTEHHGNVCTARHSSSKAAPTASEWIRLRMACGAVYFFKTVESSFRRMSTTTGLAIWACIPAFLAAFTSSGKVLAVMARMGIDASLRSASERISLVAV